MNDIYPLCLGKYFLNIRLPTPNFRETVYLSPLI